MPARSQAALLRETANHPLVAHARSLFDASIRRVEKRQPPAAEMAAPTTSDEPAGGQINDANASEHAGVE